MATATMEKADLRDLLGEQFMLVSEVLKTVHELEIARAWARGQIEFGRVKHCVTGRPGVPESMPTLFIEDGIAWEGQKTKSHGKFADLLAKVKVLPDCRKYMKYVSYRDGEETKWKTVEIKREEAEKLMVLYVQLTDKGMGGE